MAAERLQKYLARAGVASRRHAEELITAGRVTVNNTTVTELGSRVEPGKDLVAVDGKLVTPPEETSYFLLYKPVGVVTTLSDPQGRPTVANYVEETGKRLFPVGRLDYDAEGALLFTDDGALAHKLTHPSFQVPRTYLAKVKGVPDVATLDKLRGGVRLEDGMATPVSVDVFEAAERNTWLKIVVAEGRPHLIKRLCAAVGHPVVRLFRPAYAGVRVDSLRPGELRALSSNEVRLLQDVADGKTTPSSSDLKLPPRRHGRSGQGLEGGDEDVELSMDDEAPASRRRAPTEGRAREERPARGERKPAGAGGTRVAKFAARSRDEGVPRRGWREDDEVSETAEAPEAEAPRGRAPRGEGRPERREWRAGREEPAGRAPRGAGAPRGRFGGEEGRPPRGAGRFGRPPGAGASRGRFGGDEAGGRAPRGAGAPRGRFGGDETGGRAPRAGGRFGAGERTGAPRSRFGGDEGGGRAPRGAGAPRGRFGGEEAGGRPPRTGGRFGAGAGAPRGRFGGDEGGRPPRGAGAPRGRFGGDEGGRPPRGAGAPRGRFGGDEGGRPPRSAGAPRGRFGGEEGGRPPRSAGAPRGRFGGEEGGRPPRGAGAPRGRFGGDEGGRPPRGAGAPRGRFGGDEASGRPPRSAGRFGAGERTGAPRGRFGGDDAGGRAPRGAGPARGGFGDRKPGAGRPERREWKAGGDEGAPRGRAPRSEGAGGHPERRDWKPTDETGRPRERVVRAGVRRGPREESSGGAGGAGFQDWGKRKEESSEPRWNSKPPRGGAGRPPPRGPRRPR